MSEWKLLSVVAAFVAASVISAEARAENWTVGIGADYASGKYGEPTKTEDFYVPFSLAYKAATWKAKLVVPYISVRGNGEVVGGPQDRLVDDRRGSNSGSGSSGSGSGSGSNSGSGKGGKKSEDNVSSGSSSASTGTAPTTDSGLGDVTFAMTYFALADDASGLFVNLTGRVKFGTASANKGLGSGENDYGFFLDVDKDIGKFTLSAGAGFTLIGSPDGFDYRNVISATGGLGYRFTDSLSADVSVNFRQSVRNGAPNQLDISPGISLRLGQSSKVSTYLIFGLQDGSPDFGGGMSYTYSF